MAVCGIVILCHALVIATALALSFFAHPQIDDLWRAGLAHQLGFFRSMRFEYEAWCGRWLGTGLSYLLPMLTDVRQVYTEALLAVDFAYLASLVYLIRGVMPGLPRATALLLGVVQLELYWTGVTTPGETFYWLTGGFENHIGVAVPMLLIGLLVRTRERQRLPRRVMRLVGLVALAVAATGFNELYGTMLCGVLTVGAAVAWLEHRQSRLEWVVALAGAMIGWLIVYSAPGNANRMATVAHISRNLERSLYLFWDQAPRNAVRWLLDLKLQAATLAFVLHPRLRALQPDWCRWPRARARWLMPAITVGMLLSAFATHAWLTGEYMAPRTLSGLYMVFLVGWFVTLFAWTRWPQETLPNSLGLRWIGRCSVLLLAASLALAPATRLGLRDLASRARPYDKAMQQRYVILDGAVARGDRRVIVPPLPPVPLSYFNMDITNDPADFRNYHTLKFYGLESVVVR